MKAAPNFRHGGRVTPSPPAAEARVCALGSGRWLGGMVRAAGPALRETARRATRRPQPTPRRCWALSGDPAAARKAARYFGPRRRLWPPWQLRAASQRPQPGPSGRPAPRGTPGLGRSGTERCAATSRERALRLGGAGRRRLALTGFAHQRAPPLRSRPQWTGRRLMASPRRVH